MSPPSGCTFHTRCSRARDYCEENVPDLDTQVENGHRVSCFSPVKEGKRIEETNGGAPHQDAARRRAGMPIE